MSSRSLAAARARRAGESAPPVSGNRPGTSVGSAAAFSGMSQPPNNIRVARPPMPPQQYQQPPQQYQQQMPQQRQQQQQQKQPSAAYQQIQQSQQQGQNSLPFNKLSISDAIGLITLRLGRVEQWVIETEHENESKDTTTTSTGGAVDNSVLVGLLNRLEAVEKKETVAAPVVASISSEEVTKLTSELAALTDRYNKFCDEANKQTLTIAKHTEQLFRFERELVETKDILKTFMIRYDNFVQESNDKLADYEYAIAEIEKSIAPTGNVANSVEPTGTTIDGSSIDNLLPTNIGDIINPDDLKSLVKQELSAIDA